MSTEEKSLNFIEQIIEEDLKNGLSKNKLRFRFPPEPNGYLHVGHASAICLNFGLGLDYNAPVNLRFDDTNPSKEEQEYVDAIKRDVQWLGFKWDRECYASSIFSSFMIGPFYSFRKVKLMLIANHLKTWHNKKERLHNPEQIHRSEIVQ
jgi:hypothetical protein